MSLSYFIYYFYTSKFHIITSTNLFFSHPSSFLFLGSYYKGTDSGGECGILATTLIPLPHPGTSTALMLSIPCSSTCSSSSFPSCHLLFPPIFFAYLLPPSVSTISLLYLFSSHAFCFLALNMSSHRIASHFGNFFLHALHTHTLQLQKTSPGGRMTSGWFTS